MRAHVEDGRRFVERTRSRYDVVYLDGFGADSVPQHLTTREFLTAVRAVLTPQGVVIGNVWGRQVNRLYDSMVKTYRAVFDGLMVVDVIGSGNKILIALPAKSELSDHELVYRAGEVSRKLKLRYDVTEVAERNMRPPGDDGVEGKLLLDADVGAAMAR
jgi:spermidine synthase